MMEIAQIKVEDVIFDKDLYTRFESKSPAKVQEYAISIADGNFPPIIINHEKKILDGWHRWMAHKTANLEIIEAEILNTEGMDVFEIRRKASRNNSRSGIPETENEIKKKIRDEYRSKVDLLDNQGRSELKKAMAEDYSRSIRFVSDATNKIDKDHKKELRQKAFDMWMACYTQQDIAEGVGYSQQAVSEFTNFLQLTINGADAENSKSSENNQLTIQDFEEEEEDTDKNSLGQYKIEKRDLFRANHIDEEYKPPIGNIWTKAKKTNEVSHFGNSEITWLDHLLYFYTKPFDVVVDPFAGGGSTIDLCKKRLRRYLVSDRKPIEMREDIREHDIKNGVLSPPTWKDVKLIFLDPPYWKQAEGQYSKDSDDLANMELEQFNKMLSGIIKQYAEKLKRARTENAYIALIIQPTQWNSPNHEYTDHIKDMLIAVPLKIDMRFSVPYSLQQYTPQTVDWAKENKKCLVITREIIVWRVA
jgi:DNA modification methylase